jgi:restriction system protein
MTIPDFQSIMLPLLIQTKDDKEHTLRDMIDILSKEFNLSEQDRETLLPSGRQLRFDNRVGWAVFYLRKAQLLMTPERGKIKITSRGLDVIKQTPDLIDIRYLTKFKEFQEFRNSKGTDLASTSIEEGLTREDTTIKETQTPEEAMDTAHQSLQQALSSEILSTINNCSPSFFEKLVIDLLVKMGYGGTRLDAGKAIGKSGDEGIDGIINEDRLGLDVIYVQAKRWNQDSVIGRPEIHKFAGALLGQRAKKGVFITTANFTKDARDYASKIESKIILIDGTSLCQLMIDYNVGVNLVTTYELKRLDSDYFSEL